jgi:hypothetical protein
MKRLLHFSAKTLKFVFLFSFFLILAILIFLNSNFFDSYIRTLIQTKLSKVAHREMKVDSVAFNPFRLDIRLKNFSMANDPRSPEIPFFSAEEIYARVSLRQLISGRLQVSDVHLIKPTMSIIMYEKNRGGGNNWPTFGSNNQQKKTKTSVVVSRVKIDDMTVLFQQRRIPISFQGRDLEAYVEFDPVQKNHLVTTSFKDGLLKIQNFETWKFDMDAVYRLIQGKIYFEKLHFLSPHTKFFMAGTMSNLKDPYFDMRFRSLINLEETKEIFHFGPEMAGTGRFRATYKGTFGKFSLQGAGNFQNFSFFGLPIDTARFDVDLTDQRLKVNNIHANMFQGQYSGTFFIGPLKGISVFKAEAAIKNWDGLALGRFIHMKNMIMPELASGKASIVWKENGLKDMTGSFHFRMEPKQGAPYDLVREAEATALDNALYKRPFYLPFVNETEFTISGRKLRDLKSHLETPYMNADFDGTIDFSGEADLNVRTSSQKIPELDLLFHHLQSYFKGNPIGSQEFWGIKGAADFQGKLDKTVWSPFNPRITGQVQARNVFYHGVPVDTAQGHILFYDRLIEVFDSNMTLGHATGKAQAKFYLEDKKHGVPNAMDLQGAVQNFPAHTIGGAFGLDLPVHGGVNATIQLKGPFSKLVGRSDFEASNGDAWGEKIDRATGTVLFMEDSLGLRNITAYMDGGRASASGDLTYETDDYTVEFKAENVPVEKLKILKENDLDMKGIGSAEGSGSGTFTKPRLNGIIHVKDLSYREEYYGDVSATVKLDPGLLTLAATGQGHGAISSVRATAHLDGKVPFEAAFDIEKFPLEIFTRAYAPETRQLTGLLGGNFQMDGTLNPADIKHLSGALNLLQLNLGALQLQQSSPVDVRMTDNVIEIINCNLSGESTQLSLTGNIYPKQNNRLALELSANVGLDVLSKWDPSINASGPATTKVSISGTLTQPSLTGALEIREGSFRHSSLPNSLTDIQALVTFKNRNVTLQSFNAMSSGGKLTAGGSGVLKGYAFETYRFDVYADHVRVQYPEGLRTTVNGELHLQRDARESYLTGNLNVIQGIYTRSFEESPSVFRYARVPGFAGSSGAFDEVKLNIHIESNGNLLVRNNFADMTCSANLNLIGTINDPVLTGRVEVERGSITFRDRDYDILRGSLDFSNPYRTEAQLNFIAETRIREYHITLTFSGTFDRINHDITSDPPLPRDDLYALLGGFNTTTTPTQGAGVSNLLLDEGISRFVAAPLASPIERGFRKAFGLQKFHIDPTYVQSTQVATARITLEKDISKDFSVTISTNLFTVAEEIILLQYQLTDEIRITASKDELARYGVDVLVTKTFE